MSGKERATGYVVGCDRKSRVWTVKVTEKDHPHYLTKIKVAGRDQPSYVDRGVNVSFRIERQTGRNGEKLVAFDLQSSGAKLVPPAVNTDSTRDEVWLITPINVITVRFPDGDEKCYFTEEPTFEDAHRLFEEESDDGEEQVVKFESFTPADARQAGGEDGFSFFVALDALLDIEPARDVLEAMLTKMARAKFRARPKGNQK